MHKLVLAYRKISNLFSSPISAKGDPSLRRRGNECPVLLEVHRDGKFLCILVLTVPSSIVCTEQQNWKEMPMMSR